LDEKTRQSHLEKEGRVFRREEGEFPGTEHNCRCHAEPITANLYIDKSSVEQKFRGPIMYGMVCPILSIY